jgi:hypothetical protein
MTAGVKILTVLMFAVAPMTAGVKILTVLMFMEVPIAVNRT